MTVIDESLYDDFGNYIGPGQEGEHEEQNEYDEYLTDREGPPIDTPLPLDNPTTDIHGEQQLVQERYRQAIVLHEDKQYYLTAEETYGPGVETLVQEEDTQPLTQPIIAPLRQILFQHEAQPDHLDPAYELLYLQSLLPIPERVRNVAIVGHLHHGKTSLIDLLMAETHARFILPEDQLPRYMDYLFTEQERGITLRAKPLTLLLPTLSNSGQGNDASPSLVVNLIDTPGHLDFGDEINLALRMVDGVVLVVDAVEGMAVGTEEIINEALKHGLPLILVINKIERLWMELKLPPLDTYYKLRHTIEELNTFISKLIGSLGSTTPSSGYFGPERGNVLFASTLGGWMFSLPSFAQSLHWRQACNSSSKPVKERQSSTWHSWAPLLWGDIYWNREKNRFTRTSGPGMKRSFVAFVLEPLYKLYGALLSEEDSVLQSTLASIGIRIKLSELQVNSKLLIRRVMGRFFSTITPFNPHPVSLIAASLGAAICQHIPHPQATAFAQVIRNVEEGTLGQWAQTGDPQSPGLLAFMAKSYPFGDAQDHQFEILIRVVTGTLKVGTKVVWTEMEQEIIVKELFISGGRYRWPVSEVPAGNWALLRGGNLVQELSKTGTLVIFPKDFIDTGLRFKSIQFKNKALIKLAIEPLLPSELPKMKEGLKAITKSYSQLEYRVEDSGEQYLLGTGELYLDCAMHDLRHYFADMEIKVADPVAQFAETVGEASYVKCFADSPNGRNRISIIAEPLDKKIVNALEAGRLPNPQAGIEQQRDLAELLRSEYGWDILAAKSVWAFGPDPITGPCILLDETLSGNTISEDGETVDRNRLLHIKALIIQGFQWACREGPLCEEMVRGVKFKLIDAMIAKTEELCSAGQIIPTVRRACYAAILTASPRLMEPVRLVEVQTRNEFVEAVYTILAKRRGHVTFDTPKAGTPFYIIRAYLPLMDSFGFETDLRIHTQGMAFCCQHHDHWQIVPGDPLDASLKLIPLEPSPAPYLARDYLLKTRRRKGLGEDVKISKFLDEAMLAELAREEAISGIKGFQLY